MTTGTLTETGPVGQASSPRTAGVVDVLDYRGEPGALRQAAHAVLSLPLVERITAADSLHGPGFPVMRGPLPIGAGRPARSSGEITGGAVRHRLIVSPGGVQISTSKEAGWERRRGPALEVARDRRELVRLTGRLAEVVLDPWWENYRLQDSLLGQIDACRSRLGLVQSESVRGEIRSWSAKSQRNMMRTVAALDWSTFEHPGYVRAMVTLTYPGDWLTFAPDGATAKRHLQAFRRWYGRRTDGLDRGIWKLEFQGRGAPHFHLLLLVPEFPTRRLNGDSFADECRAAWHRIVKAGVPPLHGPFVREHPDRDSFHARAGMSIDVGEGARASDPARVATYFLKHGRFGGKAYQHEVPAEWATAADGDDGARPGRWWGYWRMEVVRVAGEVDYDDLVEFRRVLRGWVAAQGVRAPRAHLRSPAGFAGVGAPMEPRAWPRSVLRYSRKGRTVDPATGEVLQGKVRRRNVRRRYEVGTLSHPVLTGYVLVNNAPELVRQIAASLIERDDWPPGRRRPLP